MGFWIVAVLMAVGVAVALALPMLRARVGEEESAGDVAIYRDQLKEVERDRDRGLLADAEAERARLEVARRLLDADRRAERARGASETRSARAPRRASVAAASAVVVLVAGGALATYLRIGAPGYPDVPLAERIAAADSARANRPGQAEAEDAARAAGALPPAASLADPAFLELMDKLRAAVAEHPDDLRGQILLARNEAALGRYPQAQAAQERVLALKGGAATAEDWSSYAEMLILAAGGYVSPEAERALAEALSRDPGNGPARYFAGLLYEQTGRPDVAFRYWAPLLEDSAPGDPWLEPLRAMLPEIAARAGVRYELPTVAPGPSADDLAAAAGMSADERRTMIRGMVDGLAERLAAEGGPASDWARLVTALGVLGERDRASAILTEARREFAADPGGLAEIEAAAERAGLAP